MEDNLVNEMGEGLPDDVQEKLSKILEQYEHLSDEDKKRFQEGAFDVLTESVHKFTGSSFLPTWLVPYQSYMLFLFAVLVVGFMLAIVARKLYKSTKDRETRKEAKRRLKEQKKKKRN